MRLTRVHVPGPLAVDLCAQIAGRAALHLTRVLRLRAGDPLTVFDGTGGEYAAIVEAIGKVAVTVRIGAFRAAERESPLSVTLCQGISRAERMDWVVQKATELGVRRIVPVLTERSVVQLDARQAERKGEHWQAVATAACEQCGRNRLPQIAAPRSLHDLLAEPVEGIRLLLSPQAPQSMPELTPAPSAVTVLIGPEGGLSPEERAAAADARYVGLGMGPRILRTETAALCALALLQHRYGDLSAGR